MAKLPTVEQMKFRRYPPLKSGPPILWPTKRYFRRNEGSTDYATIPAVTLAVDQRWEFDVLTTQTTLGLFISGERANNRWYIGIEGGKILVGNASDRVAGTTIINDGRLHHVVWQVSGGIVSVIVDDILQYSNPVLATLPKTISRVMSSEVDEFFTSGILANLKIYDAGELVRDYPLNDNSDTIRDKANGQNGTIINGNASDWGLFDRQADGDWLGQNLISTPINFNNAEWMERGNILNFSGNQFTTDTTGGQGMSFRHSLVGRTLSIDYDIVCDDQFWGLRDWFSSNAGDILPSAPDPSQSGVVEYVPLEEAVYIRHYDTAGAQLILNKFSLKEVLKNA